MLNRRRHDPPMRYGVAIIGPILCIPIALVPGLGILPDTPYLLLMLAVLTSAWYGGIGPGILSTAISGLIALFFHFDPAGSFTFTPESLVRLAIFVAGGILAGMLGGARLTAEEELRARKEDLEDATGGRQQQENHPELLSELQKERERIGDLISSVPGVVWEAWGNPSASEQRIDFVSDYAEKLLGYSREEWLAVPNFWLTIVHPEDREAAATVAAQTYHSHGVGRNQFRWIARDGRTIWVDTRSMAILDASGEAIGMRGVTTDITEQRRVEQELRSAKEAAEAASLAKDNFLAMLSHEFRTPLTPVFTAAYLLGEAEGLSAEDRELVRMITQSVELEARLIDDLLELTRLDQKKLDLSVDTIDIHDVLTIALGFCQSEIAAKEQILTLDLDADRSLVEGDAGRLQQVFGNLIRNAVKFTPSGGEIAIRTLNPLPGRVRIEVCDNGIGIDPEQLGRIFRPFEQGEQTLTRRYGGLGLGLAISSAIIRLHDGTIEARSEGKNRGALFSIELPLSDIGELSGEDPQQAQFLSYSLLRVLLVGSGSGTPEPVVSLLREQGYRADTAGSAEEALEIALSRPVDIIVVDLEGELDTGLELFATLAHAGPVRGIIIGDRERKDVIGRVRDAGADEYLQRPVMAAHLLGAIRRG